MGAAAPFGDVPPSVRGYDPASVPDDMVRTQALQPSPAHAQGAANQARYAQPKHAPQGQGASQVGLDPDTTQPGYDPLTDPHSTSNTIVDVPVFDIEHELSRTIPLRPAASGAQLAHSAHGTHISAPPAGMPPSRSGGTLMGVARPGIAPLRPGISKTPAEEADQAPSYQPLDELGATQNVPRLKKPAHDAARADLRTAHPLGKRRFDKRIELQRHGQKSPQKVVLPRASPKRGIIVLAAALLLVVGAIALVVLWPSAPPLSAQVRAADGGAEVLDVTCASCPDGTLLSIRDAEAKVTSGRATIALATPLSVGDSTLKVRIDRPGSGRDESVSLPVRVAYRIRWDLTTLEADTPSLQVVVEAMEGATVELDGERVPLRDGRAIKKVDVIKDISGASADGAAQLSRKMSFVVHPPDGPEERGAVAVSVAVLPLTIASPGRGIVTEKATFVLSGHASPGAEIVVAGRSLGTTKDGSFTQTMNVSSVGATTIEVRSKMPGRAPRLVSVGVERVNSLEAAIPTFMKRDPIDYAAAMSGTPGKVGRAIALSGEVLEARSENGITTMIVRELGPACQQARCLARLVQGRTDLSIDRGAKIRAFGTVAGSIPHESSTIPDIDVAFTLVDQPAEKPPAPIEPPPKGSQLMPATP